MGGSVHDGPMSIQSIDDFILGQLPPAPARVLEVGCGEGGLATAMDAAGFDVTAVDPEAPDGPIFRRVRFEDLKETAAYDVAVASLSLHHVEDLDVVIDKIRRTVRPGGLVVVAEFGWDRIDEATGRWYAERLPADPGAVGVFLRLSCQNWKDSDGTRGIADFCAEWATEAKLHDSETLLTGLRSRFTELSSTWTPPRRHRGDRGGGVRRDHGREDQPGRRPLRRITRRRTRPPGRRVARPARERCGCGWGRLAPQGAARRPVSVHCRRSQ